MTDANVYSLGLAGFVKNKLVKVFYIRPDVSVIPDDYQTVYRNSIFSDYKYKPTKCTFRKLKLKFLIFRCLQHVSNPRVRLQEDGCVYSYGMVQFTCISLLILMHVK